MVGRNNADLSFMPAKDAQHCTQTMKNPGRIQDFLKRKTMDCRQLYGEGARGH